MAVKHHVTRARQLLNEARLRVEVCQRHLMAAQLDSDDAIQESEMILLDINVLDTVITQTSR